MSSTAKPYKFSRHVVFEAFLSRYTAGCFCHDDIVEVDADGFLADYRFKDLPEDARNKLREMIAAAKKGDAKIAIQDVGVNPMASSNYEPSTLTLAYSQGGGLYFDGITIPGALGKYLKVVDAGPNRVSNVPDNIRVDHDTERKEVDLEQQKKEYAKGYLDGFADTPDKKKKQ